jgi:hypothetical protein
MAAVSKVSAYTSYETIAAETLPSGGKNYRAGTQAFLLLLDTNYSESSEARINEMCRICNNKVYRNV